MFGAFRPAAGLQPPAVPDASWRSPASAPCSPPPTCSLVVRRVCMGDHGAAEPGAEPAPPGPPCRRRGYEFAAWTPPGRPHRPRRTVARGPPRPHRPGRPAAPRRRQRDARSLDRRASSSPSTGSPSRRPPRRASSPWSSSSPTSSCPSAASRCSGWLADGGPRRSPRSACCPSWTATAAPSACPAHPDACSYVADHVHPGHPVPGARRGAADRAAVDRQPSRTRSCPPASTGSCCSPRRPAPPCCPPPGTSPPSSSPSKSASLPAFALVGLRRDDRLLLRGRAEVLPVLGHRDRRHAARRQLRLRAPPAACTCPGSPHAPRRTARPAARPPSASRASSSPWSASPSRPPPCPFHFWVPDTYVGAPLPDRRLPLRRRQGRRLLRPDPASPSVAFPSYADVWGPALAVLAALTMTVGNVAALRQRPRRAHSAVRLLAWSSVGQAGYLLVPIAAAGYADDAGARHRLHRRLRPDVRGREPRRLRRRRPRRPVRSPATASPTTAACTPPARPPPSPSASSCCAWPGCRRASSASSPRSPSSRAAVDAGLAGSPWSWRSTS